MSLFWSLTKIATEETPTQPQTQAPAPKPTPVPVQAPVPTTVKPPQTIVNISQPDLLTWQKNNTEIVKSIHNFIQNNMNEVQNGAKDILEQYKKDNNVWETLRQFADTMVPDGFESFVQSIEQSGEKHQWSDDIKEDYSEVKSQTIVSINKTIDYINEVMGDWFVEIAKQKDPQNKSQPSVVANGIGGALDNFFFGTYQGGVPKWITFCIKHNLLTKGAEKWVRKLGDRQGLFYDINKWYTETDDDYPSFGLLRRFAKERNPALLKALINCAASIGADKGQFGFSLDMSDSEGNKIIDPGYEDSKIYDKPLMDESIAMGDALADKFTQEHPEFIEALKQAKHFFTGEQMFPILVNSKIDEPDKILDAAIRKSFLGYAYEKERNLKTQEWEYTNNRKYNKWVDFFADNPSYLPPQIKDKAIRPSPSGKNLVDTDIIDDSEAVLFPIFMQAMENPDVLSSYMGNPLEENGEPYEYLCYLYEMVKKRLDAQPTQTGQDTKSIAGFGNVDSFKRIKNLVTSTLGRNLASKKAILEALKANPNSDPETDIAPAEKKLYTAARSYIFTKVKSDAFLQKINELASTNERIFLTDEDSTVGKPDYFVQKDKDGNIKIWGADDSKGGYSDVPSAKRPLAGPLTEKNIHKLTSLVKNVQWYQQGVAWLEKNYPGALKKKEKEKGAVVTPLEQEYQTATENYQKQNPQSDDRLGGYRAILGEKVKTQAIELAQKLGVTLKNTDDVINFLVQRVNNVKSKPNTEKKKKKNGEEEVGRSGNKSRIGSNPVEFITNLINGKKQLYSPQSDFKTLSQALMLTPEEAAKTGEQSNYSDWKDKLKSFWVTCPEYDPYDINTAGDTNDAAAKGSFKFFGPYLLHKKREALRRGLVNDAFSDNSLYFFLKLMPPSGTVSGTLESEARFGRYLYELVGNRPVGTEEKDDWESVKSRVEKWPEVDLYDYISMPMSDKRYYRSQIHPSGIEIREQEKDRDKNNTFRSQHDKSKLPANQFMGGKSLDEWQNEYIEKMNQRAADNLPELLKQRLNSGEDPISITKEILSKEKPEANTDQLFSEKADQFNKIRQKFEPNKQHSPSEFAQWFVENQISTHKYFRDMALKQKKELANVDLKTMHPQKKFDLFVPSRFKTKKTVPLATHPRSLDIEELKKFVGSDIPERYQAKITKEPIQQVAIDYIKERKGLDDESALIFLQNKMNRYNRTRRYQKEEIVTNFDDYLQHFMKEVLTFEQNYRAEAQKVLPSYQADPKQKNLFPKRSSYDAFMDGMRKLSHVESMIKRMGQYGNRIDYLSLIDSITDDAVMEIMDG